MTQSERRMFLIQYLLNENKTYKSIKIPKDELSQKTLLRGLFNVREPMNTDEKFLKIQDEYLREEINRKGVTDYKKAKQFEGGIYLWQGDITTLKCGAIVNAANSTLLGCFHPNHGCIDNQIHTFAGIELRLKCAEIMKKHGTPEKTGHVKITEAYNLPCDYVIHTVGPIIYESVTETDKRLLSSCYRSCLELADERKIKSIAFCCISTGVFCFPNELAARIAVKTVRDYFAETGSKIEVIFNVFKNSDREIYEKLLRKC